MKAKKKIGLLVLGFSSIAALASCGEKAHAHEFVDHEEVFPNCVDTGTEAYKTCTGCDKIFNTDGEEIAAPVTIPVDPNDHKGTKEMVVSGSFKTAYVVGDTFDIDNAVFTIKCEHCQGSALSKEKKEKVKVTYPTEGATSFTVADLGVENLKVSFEYSGLKASANVTLSKKANVIEGLEPLSKYCGFKPFTELEGVTSTFGTIVYTFSDSENGEYKTAEQLGADYSFMNDPASTTAKTYYVKATVEAGEDYLGASASTTITISHNEGTWSTEDEDKDTFGCVCQDPVVFNKKTSGNQVIDLSKETVSMNLDGTSYDATKDEIKSIKYVVDENTTYDLGKDIASLDVTTLKEDKKNHGKATLDIVIATPEDGITPAFDHSVTAEVTFVTACVYNTAESFNQIKPLEATTDDHCVEGYYLLMEDIELKNFNGTTGWGWFSGWLDTGKYTFKGTLDGNGKTINGQSTYNGFLNQLDGATVKNLTITEAWWREGGGDYSLLAASMQNTTLTDVTIKISGGSKAATFAPDLTRAEGFISRQRFMSNTLTNVNIDASDYNIAIVFAAKNGNDNTFTDCSLKVKSYGYLWNHYKKGQLTTYDGLTITGTVYSAS